MKREITKKNSVGLVLEFMWAVFIMVGCSYLVFFKGASGWWYVLALLLLSGTFPIEKTTIEED